MRIPVSGKKESNPMKHIDVPAIRKQIISFVSLAVVLALSFVTVSVPELYAQQLKTPDSKQYSLLLQNIYHFILQNYVE